MPFTANTVDTHPGVPAVLRQAFRGEKNNNPVGQVDGIVCKSTLATCVQPSALLGGVTGGHTVGSVVGSVSGSVGAVVMSTGGSIVDSSLGQEAVEVKTKSRSQI